MALVDVVITTCGRDAGTLCRAIGSVLGQTVNDFELHVVDDNGLGTAAQMGTKLAVESFGEARMQYLPNGKNCGACASRNRGIEAGSAPFVAFLDDDDEWLPDKLEKQIAEMRDPKVGLVFCGRWVQDDGTGSKRLVVPERTNPSARDVIDYGNEIGSCSFVMLRRGMLASVGLFDEELQSAQDMDMWIRALEHSEARCATEPLAIYHVHPGTRISTNPPKKYSGLNRLYEKNKGQIESRPFASSRWHLNLAVYAARCGLSREAAAHLRKAVSACPWKVLRNSKTLAIVVKSLASFAANNNSVTRKNGI